MKTKCPICGTQNGKRQCKKRDRAEICPICCAGQRDDACGDCTHRATAQRYYAERKAEANLPGGHFIAEINPEVEQTVNDVIELAQRGKMDQARATMERLLQEHPANHSVHFGMGVLHVLLDQHKESIAWFDKATAIFPYFVEAHYNKAVACQKELDVGGAIRAYRKVVEVGDPSETEVKHAKKFLTDIAASILRTDGVDLDAYLESQCIFNRAYALLEQGDWHKALAGFRAAAAICKQNAPTYGNMGLCLAALGHRSEALKALDHAIKIDSGYEPAIDNRLAVEQMQEGVPMKIAKVKHVEFSKERVMRERNGV